MALQDIYLDPEGRYVQIYPISTRHLTVSFMGVASDDFGGGEAPWPPSLQDPSVQYIFMADDVEGIATPGGNEYDGGFLAYGDNQGIFNAYRRVITGPGGTTKENAMAIVQFDTLGIPRVPYERAEFVLPMFSTEEYDDDGMDFILEWSHQIGVGPGGEDYSIDVNYSEGEGASRAAPKIPISRIVSGPGQYADVYYDTSFFGDPPLERWAIPLNSVQAITNRSRVGIRARVVGGEPTGRNEIFGEAVYVNYDDRSAEGYDLRIAGHDLPSLRLWYGGQNDISISGSLRLAGTMRYYQERDVIYHRARLKRGGA